MAKRRMYSKTKKSNYKGGKRKMSKKSKKSRKGAGKVKSTPKSTIAKTSSKIKKNNRQESINIQKANLIQRYNDKKRELDKIDDVLMDNDPGEIGMNELELSGHLAIERRKTEAELDKLHDQIKRCERGSGCSIMG